MRGQFSATMHPKRDFVARVLRHMQDNKFVDDWVETGDKNRHDYVINMPNGKIAVIELKGCLDGNNTGIFERPPQANEFIIWSVCSNPGADPQKNAWSGIHTRLGAEIISKSQVVDGLVIWDSFCGSIRSCPKLSINPNNLTTVGQFKLPPPCIYLFPGTVPSVRNNPCPQPNALNNVSFLKALYDCFGGSAYDVSEVTFAVAHKGSDIVRTTRITKDGVEQKKSKPTAIKRT